MSPSFPAPPRSATVFSRQLGANALALAVVPRRGGRLLLQASVLGSQGKGVAGLSVSFAVQGVTNAATPCGPGCYRTTLDTSGQPSSVQLEVRGRPATRWRVALPAAWPPRDASALVAGASNAWRSLRSLSFLDRLTSGTRQSTTSTWRIQAPDRVAYQVKNGWAAIIVGERRWDRPPSGGHWVSSPQPRLTQPRPPWVSVTNAHLLGVRHRAGPARLAGLVLRPGNAWMVRGHARPPHQAHARAVDGRNGALHARQLQLVQRNACNRPSALSRLRRHCTEMELRPHWHERPEARTLDRTWDSAKRHEHDQADHPPFSTTHHIDAGCARG
jgi:hypothetical protein